MVLFCCWRIANVCKGSTRRYRQASPVNRGYWVQTARGLSCTPCYKHALRSQKDTDAKRAIDRQAVLQRIAPMVDDAAVRTKLLTVAVQQNRRFFWDRHPWSFALLAYDWQTVRHRDGFRNIWSIWRFWVHVLAYDDFDHVCLLARVRYNQSPALSTVALFSLSHFLRICTANCGDRTCTACAWPCAFLCIAS